MNSQYLRSFILDSYRDKSLAHVIEQIEPALTQAATPADKMHLAQAPLLLPDLVSLLEQLIVKADDHTKARALAGGLLTYIYNPLDFFAEYSTDFPAGLVDDVVVCALGLIKLADEGPLQLDTTADGLVRHMADLSEYFKQDLLSAITKFVNDLEATPLPI